MSTVFQYRGKWCVWYYDSHGNRKRRVLADTKREAIEVWKAGIRSGVQKAGKTPFFHTVALDWLKVQQKRFDDGKVSAGWLARVSRTVAVFIEKHPRIKATAIDEHVALGWIDESRSQAYKRTEAQVIKQILDWSVPKYIDASPLAKMRLEKGQRRERLVTIQQHREICRVCNQPSLRVLLWLCWWTGCRPIELRELKWENVSRDCSTATLRKHKNAKKKGPRVIYFPNNAQAILKRHRVTNGPMFRNSRGNVWTKDALCRHIGNLNDRTGIDVSAYAYRHSFITRALEAGMNAATVAELTGTSLEMISRNYGHLDKAKDHLRRAASSVPSSVD